MSARYPRALVDDAHGYAIKHRLSLNVVLSVALAEYLAKRRERDAGPAPQLHYRKGHPPAKLVQEQQQLMHVDPRGRKMADRCPRAPGEVPTTANPCTLQNGDRGRLLHPSSRSFRWRRPTKGTPPHP
jgi:hypothetical protein